MSNRIFFWTKWGGATMLLLIFLLFNLFSSSICAQECPAPPPCANMWVEIVRQDPDNVVTSCTGSPDVCGDKFRQVFFKVYLRVKKLVSPSDTNGLKDFNLDYSKLDVILALKNQTTPQYSHIDSTATNQCFIDGIGAKWYNYSNNNGDKVIFTPEENQVSISFANLDSGAGNCGSSGSNNTGNIITFTHGTPDNAIACPPGPPNPECFYVELFTIIVNAYPGEYIGFEFDTNGRWYVPKSTSDQCTIPIINSGTHNGLGNITVANPVSYAGTANQWIEAQLLAEEPTNDGGYDFPVALMNTDTVSRVVTYLEFALKATLTYFDKPFSYTGLVPRVISGGTDPQTYETIYYLHYLIDTSITLNPGDTVVLSKIKMGPPVLSNQRWLTNLEFEGAATSPRIRSTGASDACTRLKTSGGPITTLSIGDAFCADTSIHFKVRGVSGGCGDMRASVELYSTTPPDTIRVKKVEYTLQFDFDSPNISFDTVEYTDWPSVVCSTYGCFNGHCYTMSSDSKTFDYCFSVPNNAPTTLYLNPSKHMDLIFSSTGKGCITNVRVTKLALTYANASSGCIPRVDEPEDFSICANSIKGTVKTELGEGVEEVKIYLKQGIVNIINDNIKNCSSVTCSSSCAPDSVLTDENGAFNFCDVCATCDRFMIEPRKNDNPLNGVTTYDLVLISKHILGTEPFNTPYKIIAADANKSDEVTTFDIVTLRKLILGIDTALQYTTSWRFVDKSFLPFPDPTDPFQSLFTEISNCVAPQASTVDFIGIKVGDVNNTAMAHGRPIERPVVGLSWPNMRIAQGSIVTLPITYSGTESMEAVQLGLRFDPAVLQLIGPSQGDLESYLPGNFNLLKATAGEIRTLWLPMAGEPEPVLPGTVLFYLSFKVLADVPESGLPLWLDEQLLACSAWKSDGAEYALRYTLGSKPREQAAVDPTQLQATIRPNPSSGTAALVVQATKQEKARVILLDAFGRRLAMRELMLAEGQQEIPLMEVQGLPSGVYVWQIYTPTLKAQGHLVKQ